MLGGVPQYLFAHVTASGKEHEIKFLFQKKGIFFSAPGYHCHIFRWKAVGNNRLQQGSGGGGVGAWLYNSGIACGNGIAKGP